MSLSGVLSHTHTVSNEASRHDEELVAENKQSAFARRSFLCILYVCLFTCRHESKWNYGWTVEFVMFGYSSELTLCGTSRRPWCVFIEKLFLHVQMHKDIGLTPEHIVAPERPKNTSWGIACKTWFFWHRKRRIRRTHRESVRESNAPIGMRAPNGRNRACRNFGHLWGEATRVEVKRTP